MRDVLRVLQPIWSDKTETASRLRGRIEAVLSWATVAGHRVGDNPARWGGNLSELLAKPGKVAKTTNHAALSLADAPRWWADLAKREGMAARALQFLAMTVARSGEVRGMTWAEVDLEKALWIVPAARMKAGREHRVPLTREAVELLRTLPQMEASPYVFFAPRGGMLSDMTLSAVMRRMQEAEEKAGRTGYLDPRSGRPAVPHGLRSTFRDWAAEQGIERDMAEMALAHTVGSEVERAYRRTDMLERRRAMLSAWGDFLRGDDARTQGGIRSGRMGSSKRRRDGSAMSGWRCYAKAGRWDLMDWSDANSVPRRGWPKLLRILQVVVPKVERRDGIEYREVYAGRDDRQAIKDWVDNGRYANALAEIGLMLPRVQAAVPSPAEKHRQSVETVQQRAKRTVRLVQHAASLLDGLTAVMEEEKPWHTPAEEVAIEVLRTAGIEYRGLRETWVVEEPSGSKSLIAGVAGTGSTLDTLASNDRFAYTRPWHAARILVLCERFRAARSRVMEPGQYRPSKQTVAEHMDEAAFLAFEAGRHVQALWGKNFEGHALKGMAVMEYAIRGGEARRAQTRPKTNRVLEAMEPLVAKGMSEADAGRIVAKNGIGTSAGANRALWQRHRGPQKKL